MRTPKRYAHVKHDLDPLALELCSSTPRELVELTARERAKWVRVLDRYNIKAE